MICISPYLSSNPVTPQFKMPDASLLLSRLSPDIKIQRLESEHSRLITDYQKWKKQSSQQLETLEEDISTCRSAVAVNHKTTQSLSKRIEKANHEILQKREVQKKQKILLDKTTSILSGANVQHELTTMGKAATACKKCSDDIISLEWSISVISNEITRMFDEFTGIKATCDTLSEKYLKLQQEKKDFIAKGKKEEKRKQNDIKLIAQRIDRLRIEIQKNANTPQNNTVSLSIELCDQVTSSEQTSLDLPQPHKKIQGQKRFQSTFEGEGPPAKIQKLNKS